MLDRDEARQTAYALDQLDAAQRAEVEGRLTSAGERGDAAQIGRLSELLRDSADGDESHRPSASLRQEVETRLSVKKLATSRSRRIRVAGWIGISAAACVALAIAYPLFHPPREQGRRTDEDRARNEASYRLNSLGVALNSYAVDSPSFSREPAATRSVGRSGEVIDNSRSMSGKVTTAGGYLELFEGNTRFFGPQLLAAAANGDKGVGPVAADLPRQIVHRGGLDIRVEDFDALVEQIDELIEQHEAEIAHKNITGSPGSPRNGVWTFRVPAAKFAAFSAALGHLGELQSETTSSEDVSSTYYDTEARLKTKLATRERLHEHLKATDKTKDTVMIEEQLDRVTGDVESFQQRMNYLKNQVALATVQLTVTEVSSYVHEETPSLGTRVGRSYSGSIEALQNTGEALLLTLVAVGPWLALLAVPLLAVYLVIRRRRGRAARE